MLLILTFVNIKFSQLLSSILKIFFIEQSFFLFYKIVF